MGDEEDKWSGANEMVQQQITARDQTLSSTTKPSCQRINLKKAYL